MDIRVINTPQNAHSSNTHSIEWMNQHENACLHNRKFLWANKWTFKHGRLALTENLTSQSNSHSDNWAQPASLCWTQLHETSFGKFDSTTCEQQKPVWINIGVPSTFEQSTTWIQRTNLIKCIATTPVPRYHGNWSKELVILISWSGERFYHRQYVNADSKNHNGLPLDRKSVV